MLIEQILKCFILCFPGGPISKEPAASAEDKDSGLISGSGAPLEKEMATHSSIPACRIPWTEEPGRLLQSTGSRESDTTKRLHHRHQEHPSQRDNSGN